MTHLLTFSYLFSVYAETPDGSELTGAELRRALTTRLAAMHDDELIEAVGEAEDSQEIDDTLMIEAGDAA